MYMLCLTIVFCVQMYQMFTFHLPRTISSINYDHV